MKAMAISWAVPMLLLIACRAADQPPAEQPAALVRVVDEADLLSPEEEGRLAAESEALERRTTDQLVIVTVRSLDGRTIEDYSRNFGNSRGIGQEDKDNGVLLVVAPVERRTRIHVGFGLEPILTNARAQAIVERDLVPSFRDEHWNEGIEAATKAIVATLIEHEREPRRARP